MLSVSTVAPKGYRTLQSPSAVFFADTNGATGNSQNYNPTAIASGLTSVGLIEGPVSINQNPEIGTHMSDQLYNPYEAKMQAQGWQVTFSLDQIDIWNLALALSYADDAVSGLGSVVALTDRSKYSPLRCMEILFDSPRDEAANDLGDMRFQFWKVRAFSNGPIEIGRTTQTRAPIIVYCLANDSDQVGQIVSTISYNDPGYESTQ